VRILILRIDLSHENETALAQLYAEIYAEDLDLQGLTASAITLD
jgi:hypothetical protein